MINNGGKNGRAIRKVSWTMITLKIHGGGE